MVIAIKDQDAEYVCIECGKTKKERNTVHKSDFMKYCICQHCFVKIMKNKRHTKNRLRQLVDHGVGKNIGSYNIRYVNRLPRYLKIVAKEKYKEYVVKRRCRLRKK
ncbi:MAG: hypothetical protein ACE5RP_00140 [Nitrosopumilus sp.]